MTLPRLAAVAATALLALGGLGVAQAQPDQPHHPDPGGPGPSAAPGASTTPGPPPAGPLTSIDKDGTYQVGTQILPGTYSSAGPVDGGACYWKRDNNDQVPDNALTKKPQVVRIEATDTAFTTRDCQPWQQTNAAPPPQASPTDLLGQLGSFIGKGILSGGPR